MANRYCKNLRSKVFYSKITGEMMKGFEDLTKTLKAHREELYSKYGVTEIGIFGSFVKKEQSAPVMLTYWLYLIKR
jgi:hypothetical protein